MSDPFDTEIAIIAAVFTARALPRPPLRQAIGSVCLSATLGRRHFATLQQADSRRFALSRNGQLPLVYHSLQERKLLLRNAPDLVKAVPFYIPIYRDSSRRPWQIFAGLSLYFLLSGGSKLGRFRRLRRQEWADLPGLKTQDLQAVFQYWDGQTDDRLLTESVVNAAHSLGAKTLAGWELISAQRSGEDYLLKLRNAAGEQRESRCQCLINAAGPGSTTVPNALRALRSWASIWCGGATLY